MRIKIQRVKIRFVNSHSCCSSFFLSGSILNFHLRPWLFAPITLQKRRSQLFSLLTCLILSSCSMWASEQDVNLSDRYPSIQYLHHFKVDSLFHQFKFNCRPTDRYLPQQTSFQSSLLQCSAFAAYSDSLSWLSSCSRPSPPMSLSEALSASPSLP